MQGVNLPLHWLFFPSSRRHYCASGSVAWTAVFLVDSIYVLTLYILLGSIAGNQNGLFTRSTHCAYRLLCLLYAGNQ